MKPITLSTLALVVLLSLVGCSRADQSTAQPSAAGVNAPATMDSSDASAPTWLGDKIGNAMRQARQEIATRNIDVDSVHFGRSGKDFRNSRPKAEITPQGELLIAGNKVDATPAQQVLLLDYRQQIISIADAGIDIGTQGADLGLNAAREALRGAFSGKSDKEIEAAIKPHADKIRLAAAQLCQRLPQLLASQRKLAAAMPAFKPYATMQQEDIDHCTRDLRDEPSTAGTAS